MKTLYESILSSTGAGAISTPIQFTELYDGHQLKKIKEDYIDFFKNYPGFSSKKVGYAFDVFDASWFSGCDLQFAKDEIVYDKLGKLRLSYLKKQDGSPILFKVKVRLGDEWGWVYYLYMYRNKTFTDISEELENRPDIVEP